MAYRRIGPDEHKRACTRAHPVLEGGRPASFRLTSLPVAVASWILDSIDFIGMVNSSVEWDAKQWKISPGDAIKAIALACVTGGCRPAIHSIAARFRKQPVELLFDSVSKPEDLSRGILSRALDALHLSDPVRLTMAVSAALRTRFGIVTKVVHSDTTSVSVSGEYDCYDEDGNAIVVEDGVEHIDPVDSMHITHGYSKDRRPDLKQYMLGTAVDENGIPLVVKPLDGNTADSEWNRQCFELLHGMLTTERLVYVADSKLVTMPLVSSMARDGVVFLSRCPESFGGSLLSGVLEGFDPADLRDVGPCSPRKGAARRRAAETDVSVGDVALRAVVVETSTFAGRGAKAIAKAASAMDAAIEGFHAVYGCNRDAAAFERFRRRHARGIFDLSASYTRVATAVRGGRAAPAGTGRTWNGRSRGGWTSRRPPIRRRRRRSAGARSTSC